MSSRSPEALELLRWWHQHQAQKLNRVADQVRNGLLQELLAIRRQLEVSCETEENAAAFGCDRHLSALEHIYNQLENFSDGLNSPFLDSLPLALQHAIQPWHRQLTLRTEFPNSWTPDPTEHVQLFITLVDSLLGQFATQTIPPRCNIELIQRATTKELICYATGDDLSAGLSTDSLFPLLETFRLLTQGEYDQTVQPQLIRWELRWHSVSPLSSIVPEPHHDRIY